MAAAAHTTAIIASAARVPIVAGTRAQLRATNVTQPSITALGTCNTDASGRNGPAIHSTNAAPNP